MSSPWGEKDKQAWFETQSIQRSYQQLVLNSLFAMENDFDIRCYGVLSLDPARYPLHGALTKKWQSDLPAVLITGGIHGYETSGVMGALAFMQSLLADNAHFLTRFNFVVVPCVSPWGFETINRWNPKAIDPNRSFKGDGESEESAALIAFLKALNVDFLAHFDLHETTDTDNTVFRPALAARDGIEQPLWEIPDGFYVVDDSAKPQPAFQKAVIESVAAVTHIAPSDAEGNIIGSPIVSEGVIEYDKKPLGLCGSVANSPYVTTTEVYPDSPSTNPDECNRAQVAAIVGGLNYLISQ